MATLTQIAGKLEQLGREGKFGDAHSDAVVLAFDLLDELEEEAEWVASAQQPALPSVQSALPPGLTMPAANAAESAEINRTALSRTCPRIKVRHIAALYRKSVWSADARKHVRRFCRITAEGLPAFADSVGDKPRNPGKVFVPDVTVPQPDERVVLDRRIEVLALRDGLELWPFARYFSELAGRLDEPIDFSAERERVLEIAYHALLSAPCQNAAPIILNLARHVSRTWKGHSLTLDEREDVASELVQRWMQRRSPVPTYVPEVTVAPPSHRVRGPAEKALWAHANLMKLQVPALVQRMRDPDGPSRATRARYRLLGKSVDDPAEQKAAAKRQKHEADGYKTPGAIKTDLELGSDIKTIRAKIDKLSHAGKLAVADLEGCKRQVPIKEIHILLAALPNDARARGILAGDRTQQPGSQAGREDDPFMRWWYGLSPSERDRLAAIAGVIDEAAELPASPNRPSRPSVAGR